MLGAGGHNAGTRVGPALARLGERVSVIGFDVKPPTGAIGFPCVTVRDDADLYEQLKRLAPTDVLIETPDDCHRQHIKVALRAGARRIFCEKPLADTSERAAELVSLVAAARGQEVFVIDHHTLLEPVLCLLANRSRWLGEVTYLRVQMFEARGVPPHQEWSPALGMANFFHHPVALAGLFFDSDDLELVAAQWARHPDARVPDTYRAARFRSKRTGKVVFDGAVGKYLPPGSRRICVEGTHGQACLDRDREELRISRPGQPDHTVVHVAGDNGYGELARALAGGPLPATLLSVEQALAVLRLVEQAQAVAREVLLYSRPDQPDFVTDWALPEVQGTPGRRWYLSHDEVNDDRARRGVEARGQTVGSLEVRDGVPAEEEGTLLIDWDSLESEAREAVLGEVLARPLRRRVGMHSRGLAEEDVVTLRRKGVAVFERLEPDAIEWLLDGQA
jgi:predicted dehydrogenase